MRRVDADNEELFVPVDRLEIVGEVSTVGPEGTAEALPDPVERDVVISWNDERGCFEARDETSRLTKLLGLGSLRQVPRHDHQVGLALGCEPQHACCELRQMGRAEVDVRDMENLAHG